MVYAEVAGADKKRKAGCPNSECPSSLAREWAGRGRIGKIDVMHAGERQRTTR